MTEQLQAEIKSIEEELAQLDPRTAAYDEVLSRLELKRVELAAQTAQEELFSEFENITVGEIVITLREMCVSEQHYQLLSSWLQTREGDRAQAASAVESSYKSQIAALEDQVADLDQYRKKSLELEDELADMAMKRDAASDELENAKEEIKRLTVDNTSLRTQLEAQAKPVATNINANMTELAKQIHDQKPAIYDVQATDPLRKVEFTARLAETGELITDKYIYIRKYRVLDDAEASRFREEYEAKKAAEAAAAAIPDTALVAPPLHFPSEEGYGDGLAEESSSLAGSPVTREEYERAVAEITDIKSRLDRIEQEANVSRGAA